MKWDEVKQMICTKCGARLQQTDQFCPKCGAKVIKDRRCPDCGEVLRDGVKFCPGCGKAVGSKKSTAAVLEETLDIPIEAIEKNILSETAAEIKAERKTGSASRKPAEREQAPVRRSAAGDSPQRRTADGEKPVRRTSARTESVGSAPSRRAANGQSASPGAPVKKKQAAVPAPPPRKKKPVYREEVWDDEEDWDEDDWDDDEEGIDAITIMTVVTGCILLIVVGVLGFHFYRQYVPKNYDKAAEEEQEQETEEEQGEEKQEETEQDGEEADGQEQSNGGSDGVSKLIIVSNVNVRDQPSTSGTNVLKVAKAGETYVCNGFTEDGEWYEIVLEDGTVGYVFHDYVSAE